MSLLCIHKARRMQGCGVPASHGQLQQRERGADTSAAWALEAADVVALEEELGEIEGLEAGFGQGEHRTQRRHRLVDGFLFLNRDPCPLSHEKAAAAADFASSEERQDGGHRGDGPEKVPQLRPVQPWAIGAVRMRPPVL